MQEQFGKGIGQLLFDGKITLREALNGNGLQALPLFELRRRFAESVHSDEFKARFAQLQQEVADAKRSGMKLADVRREIARDRVWQAATLNRQSMEWLNAKNGKVWLSEDTVVKQLYNHTENNVWVDWLYRANYLLNNAELVVYARETKSKLIFMKRDNEIVKTVVKVTGDKEELYLVSIFKTNDKEIARVREQHQILFDDLDE